MEALVLRPLRSARGAVVVGSERLVRFLAASLRSLAALLRRTLVDAPAAATARALAALRQRTQQLLSHFASSFQPRQWLRSLQDREALRSLLAAAISSLRSTLLSIGRLALVTAPTAAASAVQSSACDFFSGAAAVASALSPRLSQRKGPEGDRAPSVAWAVRTRLLSHAYALFAVHFARPLNLPDCWSEDETGEICISPRQQLRGERPRGAPQPLRFSGALFPAR